MILWNIDIYGATVSNNCIDYKEKSDDEKNVDNLGTMGSLDDDGSEG